MTDVERENMENEMRACKQLLTNSDYSILKSVEDLFSCTDVAGLLSFLTNIHETIKSIIESRVAWRKRINEIEEQMKKGGGGDDMA